MTRNVKPCGTEAAYYRHRRNGEKPCQACVNGMAQTRILRGVTKRQFRPAQHGTYAKYAHGCRCDDCRQANTEYMRQWRRRKTHELRRGTIRDVVIDYMFTLGYSITSEALASWVVGAHPELSDRSVARTLHRMKAEGLVESSQRLDEWVWRLSEEGERWFDPKEDVA